MFGNEMAKLRILEGTNPDKQKRVLEETLEELLKIQTRHKAAKLEDTALLSREVVLTDFNRAVNDLRSFVENGGSGITDETANLVLSVASRRIMSAADRETTEIREALFAIVTLPPEAEAGA